MKELEEMTEDELRELAGEAAAKAKAINDERWKEANEFWDNLVEEYEFRASVISLAEALKGREQYFRNKPIDAAVRVEARYTEDTVKRALEGYHKFEGRAYGSVVDKYKENKWEGMTYLLVDGKVVTTTGGGSVWASVSWEDNGWTTKETYLKRFERILKIEKWLADPKRIELLFWKETDPWN